MVAGVADPTAGVAVGSEVARNTAGGRGVRLAHTD